MTGGTISTRTRVTQEHRISTPAAHVDVVRAIQGLLEDAPGADDAVTVDVGDEEVVVSRVLMDHRGPEDARTEILRQLTHADADLGGVMAQMMPSDEKFHRLQEVRTKIARMQLLLQRGGA